MSDVIDWDDSQWQNFKFWLENLLREKTVELIFTKVDGTTRVMQATKRSSIISDGINRNYEKERQQTDKTTSVTKVKRKVKELKDTILVWDIEVDDWRTVKVKNLQNIIVLILQYDYKNEEDLFKIL